MATLQTGIELNDQFTGVIYNIIDAVNMSVSAMEEIQRTMNSDIDASGIEGVRDEINQATMAMNELNAAMQNPTVVNTDGFAPQPVTDAVAPPDMPEQSHAPPDPVEIPVTWDTNGLEVFTGTGIERFQQEVQSTNQMLEQLSTTQDAIARQAFNTNILPPQAFQDLNRLAVRVDNVRERIQQIENNPMNIGTDAANAELEQLRGQLNQAVQEQQDLNRAMEQMDVSGANDAYIRLSQTVGNTERYIRDNIDEQGRFNQSIQEGTNQADDLMNTTKGAVAAYVSIQSVGKALDLSDGLAQTTARLNMMNDGMQSTEELTNMVYAAAQNARGSFFEMADVVARFGNNAKDAFGSSEEVVAFAELIQKQMTIAGASTTEASNAMLQLSQGLGSGTLRGDELNSIFEQAPNLVQNIADYLDVPIGQIREMASEGEITADIVKSAIFSATDEINANFEQMPMTWGQVWENMQNAAVMAFRSVLQRINEIANSEAFQTFVNGAIEAMAVLASVVMEVFDFMAQCASFVADNWSIISPIIYGVAAALMVYYGAQLAVNTINAISKGIHTAMAIAQMIHAAATGGLTAATAADIAAQNGLNAAMSACPLVWIIILIIALIALFYAAVAAVNKFAGTSVSATGIICGVFMVAAAFIGNLFVTLINFVIDIFVVLWNFIAAFANFFANVFTDPVGAIVRLLSDLVDTALSLLQSLASAIDTIFGSNLAGSVQGWRDSIGGLVDDTFGKGTEVMAQLNAEDMHLGRFEYGSAWNAGYSFGEGVDNSISNFDPSSLLGGGTDIPNPEDYASQYGDVGNSLGSIADDTSSMGNSLGNIADDTSGISDAMDVTDEDLKYLRDIAEQEAVNRYTTAEIKIEQTNNNNISSGMDLDGVVNGLTDAVNEAVDNITEGVHK